MRDRTAHRTGARVRRAQIVDSRARGSSRAGHRGCQRRRIFPL